MRVRLMVFLVLLSPCAKLSAQIPPLERVEPAFWWVGMKNPKLQLIVHGNNIAGRVVKLNYPGVKLVATHKVENPNYLFLDLEILPSVQVRTETTESFCDVGTGCNQ